MGPGVKRHTTVRPDLVRAISPASDRTSRCFITAGSDTANGAANALTESPGRFASRATNARRVGSASAANVRSSRVPVTIRCIVRTTRAPVKPAKRLLSLKLRKRWTWRRRLPLGVEAAATRPSTHKIRPNVRFSPRPCAVCRVKTLRGITAPGILRLMVMLRAKKCKNSSSAQRYNQIRFRFHTA